MTDPLTAADLDKMPCAQCGRVCDGEHSLEMVPRCHMGAGLSVTYARGGVIGLHCHECGEFVARIGVAS